MGVSNISFLHGVLYQVGDAGHAQFVHDMGTMALHGAGADEEGLCYCLVRLSLGYQFQDFYLTERQRLDCGFSTPQDLPGKAWRDIYST